MGSRAVVVKGTLGEVREVHGVRVAATGGEDVEVGEDVVLCMAADPGPGTEVSCWERRADYWGIYRMSEKKVVIIRVSAWRTAVSRPFASQSHWASAGEEQIAQSGSIVSGFSRSRYGSRSLESRVNEMVTGKTWRRCR